MEKTCIIIGGGTSGLFTGALLSKEGYKVTVLEKNRLPGGGLQMFRAMDTIFETGMHVVGGFIGGPMEKLAEYLGIRDSFHIVESDRDAGSRLYIGSDTVLDIPCGRERFTAFLSGKFPEESAGIRAYVDSVFSTASRIPMLNLVNDFFIPGEEDLVPYDESIARYVRDTRLRAILGYLNLFSGAVPGKTPAYIHAIVNSLYISSSGMLAGGTSAIVKALCSVISEGGGTVVTGCEVTEIAIADRKVLHVATGDGRKWEAGTYISSIHPSLMLKLSGGKAMHKAGRTRIGNTGNTLSAFCIFIRLKKGSFPYINSCSYIYDSYGDINGMCMGKVEGWPHGIMFITPPPADGTGTADRMIAICPMDFSAVRKWEGTVTGRRGEEYLAWKEECTVKVLDRITAVRPELAGCIETVSSGSPLTIRDFYGSENGALYGVGKDCRNPAASMLSPRTRCGNLFMTGQSIFLHGLCGAALTSVLTAESITGKNTITTKIRQCNGH